MTNEALRLSLEALEETAIVMKQYIDNGYVAIRLGFVRNAINAIKEVQAQPEQEPVNGRWYRAKEIDEMVRHLDIAMNGDNAAPQAALCDLMPTLVNLLTSPPQRQPLTDEQDRALCEAYCNGASDEYFKARPALDFPEMRRIFYAGHRKAWITRDAAHGIGEKT
jgi:hypothetical protein